MSRDKIDAVPPMDEESSTLEHLESKLLRLSSRDTQAFVETLLNPPPVNDRMRETIRRYREIMSL